MGWMRADCTKQVELYRAAEAREEAVKLADQGDYGLGRFTSGGGPGRKINGKLRFLHEAGDRNCSRKRFGPGLL